MVELSSETWNSMLAEHGATNNYVLKLNINGHERKFTFEEAKQLCLN